MTGDIHDLFRRYLKNEASAAEIEYLLNYFSTKPMDQSFIDLVDAEWSATRHDPSALSGLSDLVEKNRRILRDRLREDPKRHIERSLARFGKLRRVGARKYATAIAAVLVLAVTIGAWILQSQQRPQDASTLLTDIFPGDQAIQPTITLRNGRVLTLNTQYHEIITDGQLRYEDGSLVDPAPQMQTKSEDYILHMPAGRTFRVRLQDSTVVWLNGGTTLHYPAYFDEEGPRLVSLEGEAFFEVAHHANRPFFVKTYGKTIQVLGTTFNVNAYRDEPGIRTTLVTGMVRIKNEASGKTEILEPGQQATVRNESIAIEPVDVRLFTAWKDGVFKFDNTPLPVLLRQISRWYDVEIDVPDAYEDRTFFGEIDRNYSLADVLNILELGNIHYQLKKNASGKYRLVIEPN